MESSATDELAAILATTVDAIIIMDERGIIESFNAAACAIFGYSTEECVGQSVTMLMGEPHRSEHQVYVDHYLSTGKARIIGIGRELEAQHRDGHAIPIYLAVSEVATHGHRRFTGIIRDLTEQQATRATLAEQREKLAHVGRLSTMGEMMASIAHEINQPLTAIAMYAQAGMRMIATGASDLERLRGALDKLNTQSLRAGAVIDRIQRFAKAQQSEREFVDLNDLLNDLVKLAEADIRMYDIQLSLDLQPDLPPVRVDPVQIQQVALNLIRNAIDATLEINAIHGRGLILRTSASASGNQLLVEVRDQGPGVAPEKAELVFEPFHTSKRDGMGMGLSICRSIIVEHGGELNFHNNADTMSNKGRQEHSGATFFFTLPVADLDRDDIQ